MMSDPNKKSQKMIYLSAFALLGLGLGYLVFSGLSENSVYFLNVSEALAMPDSQPRQARLFGKVGADNIVRPKGDLGVSFDLEDKEEPGKILRVEYSGAVPDTFKPGVEVIVEGGYDPASTNLKASSLLTKCPSKYQKKKD